MEKTEWELAVTSMSALLMWIAGIVVVLVLIGAFILGRRIQNRESPRPTPEEQPKMPEGGPVVEEQEYRDPDEVPQDGGRLLPHELKGGYGTSSTHRSASQDPEDHKKGNNSSFGSGGFGS
ncbi:DUF6479 family protein [Streptomyces sp. NPDC046939]|uniref:DUF6479 family protein n=1 Tax=Streptomyces sp. NPDC046939 TaxID=3155376 RepID=UPI0033E885DA